jgi:hypothetical protein
MIATRWGHHTNTPEQQSRLPVWRLCNVCLDRLPCTIHVRLLDLGEYHLGSGQAPICHRLFALVDSISKQRRRCRHCHIPSRHKSPRYPNHGWFQLRLWLKLLKSHWSNCGWCYRGCSRPCAYSRDCCVLDHEVQEEVQRRAHGRPKRCSTTATTAISSPRWCWIPHVVRFQHLHSSKQLSARSGSRSPPQLCSALRSSCAAASIRPEQAGRVWWRLRHWKPSPGDCWSGCPRSEPAT